MTSETAGFHPTRRHLGIIFLFWAVVYGASLFHPALLDDADSVHAEAAKEILLRHDWVTLHINGIRYLEKAPLLYWGIASSFRILGIHDWSARLPLALGVLGLLYCVYFVGRREFGEKAGLYACFASGLALGPFIFTRFLIPDVLVGLWFVMSLGFFLQTLEDDQPSRLACWGLAASCALNVLTKGLIGLVFPIATIGTYLLLTGRLRHLLKLRLLSSAIVFLAIAAPWHILAGLRNPAQGQARGFFWFYFVNEHFLRYINKRVPRDYGTVPLALFWGLLLVWLFPWSAFLPQAVIRAVTWPPRQWEESRAARARLVFFLGAMFVMLFFSFSTRQEYYVLPALPAFALLLGSWLGEEEAAPVGSSLRRWGQISSAALAAIGLVSGVVTITLAILSPVVPRSADIAELLQSGPAESQQYALSLGHFLDLNTRVMGAFHAPLLLFGLSLLVGCGLNWHFRRRDRVTLGNYFLAGSSVALLVAVHMGLVAFSPVLTSKPLADAIEKVYQPGDIIEINGEYEGGSTLNYYTGHPVRILNGRSANLWYGSFFPDAPQIFDDNDSFRELWNGPKRVFLWTETEEEGEGLKGIDLNTVHVLAKSGGKLILTNRAE